ncbi:MAG: hypothetical protein IPH88_05865 [Bacteroidales bacterium]|nr:hypothetical protein [Bacteroidales bacterium]
MEPNLHWNQDFHCWSRTFAYPVSDANGCTTSTTITVGEPALLVASSSSGSILCHGGTTTVTVSAVGGTAPYSGTGNFTVGAGTHTYPVSDANGCTTSTTIIVGEPALLVASSTSGSIQCNGGTTTVTVSAVGGTGTYTGTGTFSVGAGTYTYPVSDANGCTTSTTITVGEPALLVASSSSGIILCNGGTTTVTVSAVGGTGTYTGTGTFIVGAGTHTYPVSDANGCTASTTIIVGEPALLVASSTSGSIQCNGGTTTVTVSAVGGTGTYTGTGTFSVGAGTYTYPVSDANGCTTSTTIIVGEPALLVASSTSGSILCHGGITTFTVSAVGGTGTYTGTGTFSVEPEHILILFLCWPNNSPQP